MNQLVPLAVLQAHTAMGFMQQTEAVASRLKVIRALHQPHHRLPLHPESLYHPYPHHQHLPRV